MNKLIEKPHLIFLLSIPIIILIGILRGDAVLDINVHDTYYIIAYLHLAILISILFGIIGLGYWIMLKAKRKLSKWLTLLHVTLTFAGLILIYSLLRSSSQSEFPIFDDQSYPNSLLTFSALLLIFSQSTYVINIIIGIFIKNKN